MPGISGNINPRLYQAYVPYQERGLARDDNNDTQTFDLTSLLDGTTDGQNVRSRFVEYARST